MEPRGLSVGADPEIFFPSHGDLGTEECQICASCHVRGDCLKYATEADEFGIRAGLDQQQRRALHQEAAAPRGRYPHRNLPA